MCYDSLDCDCHAPDNGSDDDPTQYASAVEWAKAIDAKYPARHARPDAGYTDAEVTALIRGALELDLLEDDEFDGATTPMTVARLRSFAERLVTALAIRCPTDTPRLVIEDVMGSFLRTADFVTEATTQDAIATLEQGIAARDEYVSDLTHTLQDKDAEIAHLRGQLDRALHPLLTLVRHAEPRHA